MPSRRQEEDLWGRIREDIKAMGEDTEGPWDRIPCADDSCIGLVGEDGCCRVCGKKHGQDYVSKFSVHGVGGVEGPCDSEDNAAWCDEEECEDEEDLEDRVLCSDESCIGLVSEDGYCKVCGLKWKPEGYNDGETFIYRKDTES